MTLIEAMATNRPFKRPTMQFWNAPDLHGRCIVLNREDVLASDWIIQAAEVVVSADRLKEAMILSGVVDADAHAKISQLLGL